MNKTLVGAFVIGAVVLMITGVLIFGSGALMKKKDLYVLHFDGSIRGLKTGAAVLFRGVRIGSVREIIVSADAKTMDIKIPIIIEVLSGSIQVTNQESIEPRDLDERILALINIGLRAQLVIESFVTGQMVIALDFYPETPVKIVNSSYDYPEIPTIPSAFEKLSTTFDKLPIEDILYLLNDTLNGMNNILKSSEIRRILKNFDRFSGNLDPFLQNVDTELKLVSDNIGKTADAYRQLAEKTNQQIGIMGEGVMVAVNRTDRLIRQLNEQMPPVSEQLQDTLKAIAAASLQVKDTVHTMEGVVAEDSPVVAELTQTLKELSAASQSLRALTDYLRRHPEAIIVGKTGQGR